MSNCVYNVADVCTASRRTSVRTLLCGSGSLRGVPCVSKGCKLGGSPPDTHSPPASPGTSEPKGLSPPLTTLPQILTALGMGSSSFPGLRLPLPPAPPDCHGPAAPNFCLPERATLMSAKGSLHRPFPVRRACPPGVAVTAPCSPSEPLLMENNCPHPRRAAARPALVSSAHSFPPALRALSACWPSVPLQRDVASVTAVALH